MQAAERQNDRLSAPIFKAAARLISLEAGLYAIEVHSDQRANVAARFKLPCVHIDAVPASAGTATFRILGEQQFAAAGDPPAYLRVEDGTAALMLTVYRLGSGMAPPELRIVRIRGLDTQLSPDAVPSEPLTVTVHVERTGDLRAQGGNWAGLPGSASAIEGFAIGLHAPLEPSDIEYQAVLGHDWITPWFNGGEFCGSRGLSLPILGLRIRLRTGAATRYTIGYQARFTGNPDQVAAADGALCTAGTAPLEALRVTLTPRPDATQPARRRKHR